jgi:hypothetical protein
MVTQSDAAWGDQHGGPRDPQPGHEHNHRDIHRTTNNLLIGSGPDTTAGQIGSHTPDPVLLPVTVSAIGPVTFANRLAFQLTFTGLAGALVTWTVTDGVHTVSGTGTIGGAGIATVIADLSSLSDGTLTISIDEADGFGNDDFASTTVAKHATPPAAPVVSFPSATFSSSLNSWVTNAMSPVISTTGDPALVRTVYVDGVVWDGSTGLGNGLHTVSATLTDAYGNVSAMSAVQNLTIEGATAFNTSMTLNGGISLVNHAANVTLGVSATGVGAVSITITITNAATHVSTTAYTGLLSGFTAGKINLPATEGLYTVAVTFTDSANTVTLSQSVTLDSSGPTITVQLSAPTNGQYYDVGGNSTLTWTATDVDGVQSSSGCIDSSQICAPAQTIASSGGHIDLDSMTAGLHTVYVTAIDNAGNSRQVSLSFTIRVTAPGLKAAIADGIARGWVPNATLQANLLSQAQSVIDFVGKGNSAQQRLKTLVSTITSATTTQLSAAFKALLLNWTADLATRL